MTQQAAHSTWTPMLGGLPDENGARFRVWAPAARRVDVVVVEEGTPSAEARRAHPLCPDATGTFAGQVNGLRAGTRYWYRLDGDRLLPDPASRFQPDGVHGPSELVDSAAYAWQDRAWRGPQRGELVIYELHVGAFTAEGTFAGVQSKLDHLADLGITAIELMPVAEFPGRWNWGYDGVDLFAPSHHYGRPDDLRRLVDAAHGRGLGVILDVVYNHLGPDGAYLSAFSPDYFTNRHKSPWGDGMNLDGPRSAHVRDFFVENALHWIHEYHLDGLRLDATHALQDDGPRHFLADLAEHVRQGTDGRRVVLIAEDERNLDRVVRRADEGGYGLDGVWADDFHHHVRRLVAGDAEGYFQDFSGSADDIATTLRRGWFFVGQHSAHAKGPRGSDPSGVPLDRFLFCLQNHDQVGNRALGDRLHHRVDLATYRAASALLLCAPETPLLFMGQEWAASSPFLYFTDHHEELGRLVTAGRRSEFSAFAAFADPAARRAIPDPQSGETFARSRLAWPECDVMPHAGIRRLYRALLTLRRTEPALAACCPCSSPRPSEDDDENHGPGMDVEPLAPGAIAVRRRAPGAADVLVVVRLTGHETLDLAPATSAGPGTWQTILTTEDDPFSGHGRPPRVLEANGRLSIVSAGPAAVLLRRT